MTRIQGDLRDRTFQLAGSILVIVDSLPNNNKGWEIGRQLIRCGGSVGANVREADNALTDADFAHKCSIARKEASETHYWLQLCETAGLLNGAELQGLIQETDEVVRILSTIVQRTQEYLNRNKTSDRPTSVTGIK
ncbi:MAG: four helix bundle protein [Phycisphaerales bacterium]|nr:four helix bundle protein [Phycisphaerales bacterium]